MDLSDEEKEKRKREIIEETESAKKLANREILENNLEGLNQRYDYDTLDMFDYRHEGQLNKEKWMRDRYCKYAKEEQEKAREKHLAEHPNEWKWIFLGEDNLPNSDLYLMYKDLDELLEYDKRQKKELKDQTVNLTEEKQEFVLALGKAYVEYLKEDGFSKSDFKNNREKLLLDEFSKYFAANYDKLTSPGFLIEFENGKMEKIMDENNLQRSFIAFGRNSSNSHIKVSEGLIYSSEGVLSTSKVVYGTKEALQSKIDNMNSRIRFMQDTNEESWNINVAKRQRNSFVEYMEQLQGKRNGQSLESLDEEKTILEGLDRKATEVLKGCSRSEKSNNDINKIEDIEFDD